jgi:hypothetical protein
MASLARINSSLTCRSVLIARRMAVIAHPECGRAGRCVAVIAITSRGSACLSGRLSWIARACEGTLYGQWKRGGEHPDMTRQLISPVPSHMLSCRWGCLFPGTIGRSDRIA